MKRLTWLLIVLGTAMLIGGLAQRETRSAPPDDFRFDLAALKDRSVWTQVNTEPYYISAAVDALCRAPTTSDYASERKSNPHAGTFITVYVNGVGRDAMFAKESQRFPKGSVIVKEKIGTDSEGRAPVLYTLMRKREPGYNPAVGDWEFMVVAPNGKLEASGKLENCEACHKGKSDSDFLFRSYVKAK